MDSVHDANRAPFSARPEQRVWTGGRMTEETKSSSPLPFSKSHLRYVYVAGIALNLVALAFAATREQYAGAATLGLVVFYLCARLWMLET